jgi:hypothetical protein
MRSLLFTASFVAIFTATNAFASPNHQPADIYHEGMSMPAPRAATGASSDQATSNTVRAVINHTVPLQIGKPNKINVSLFRANTPLGLEAFREVHTARIHMLVVDPTLSDYHHVHPKPTSVLGEYQFTFVPKKAGYRIWTDVTPQESGKQEYVQADLGIMPTGKVTIDKRENSTANVSGYKFVLTLDSTPEAGKPLMASISISTGDGKPFNELEPVMGAFAHMVGFGEDYTSILHIHPMGKEPESTTERGGPLLQFHLKPENKGFIFQQKQIYVY